VCINELVPITEGIEILGASSDHLVIVVTDAEKHIDVGTVISFKMNYKALLKNDTIYTKNIMINPRRPGSGDIAKDRIRS
jgi:predicted amino acid racemase